jgi:biopolymer transport protein ExbB
MNSMYRWPATTVACLLLGMVTTTLAVQARAQDEKKAEPKAAAPAENEAEPEGDAPAAPEAPEKATSTSNADKNFLIWLHEASGPFGYMIFLESFVLVAMIVMSIMSLRREAFMPAAVVEAFDQKVQAKDYQGAYEVVKKDDSFLGKVLAGGMARLSKGYDEAVAGMQQVGEDESMALDHKLSIISLIGTTAPMLGLLGTVQGMVLSFNEIASSDVSPKPSALASGITMALVTTLEGLIVAIPAIVAFNLAKNRQARLTLDAASVAENLMSRYAGVKRPASGPEA